MRLDPTVLPSISLVHARVGVLVRCLQLVHAREGLARVLTRDSLRMTLKLF